MKLAEWPGFLVRDWMNHRVIEEHANKKLLIWNLVQYNQIMGSEEHMLSVAVQSSVLLSEAKKFCYLYAIGKHLCNYLQPSSSRESTLLINSVWYFGCICSCPNKILICCYLLLKYYSVVGKLLHLNDCAQFSSKWEMQIRDKNKGIWGCITVNMIFFPD